MTGITHTVILLLLGCCLAQGGNDIDPLQPVVEGLSRQINQLKTEIKALQDEAKMRRERNMGEINGLKSEIKTVNNFVHRKVVAFSAYMTGANTFYASEGHIVPFHSVFVNVGGGYNPSTSVFTAPVDGLYIFIVHVDCSTTYRALDVAHNGKRAFSAENDAGDGHVTGSGILHLRKGDTVETMHYSSKGHIDAGTESTFSGFLIK